MTRLNWSKARQRKSPNLSPDRMERAADRFLSAREAPMKTTHKPRPAKAADIWITVGADCPWNSTPGVRQVHNFRSVREAREAGFADVR